MSERATQHRAARPRRVSPSARGTNLDLLWAMVRELFDPYRPERHYMRGPGPKWRAKHESVPVAAAGDAQLLPA